MVIKLNACSKSIFPVIYSTPLTIDFFKHFQINADAMPNMNATELDVIESMMMFVNHDDVINLVNTFSGARTNPINDFDILNSVLTVPDKTLDITPNVVLTARPISPKPWLIFLMCFRNVFA